MTSFAGLNRGYLFGIGQNPYKDHVYVTDPQYPLDPFTNPKLRQTFDASEVIVTEFEDASDEHEIYEFFQTLPKRLQDSLPTSDLQKLKKTLEPVIDQLPGLKKCASYEKLKAHMQGSDNDAADAVTLALYGILNWMKTTRKQVEGLSPQKPIPETTAKQRIQDRATLQSKQIVLLSAREGTPKVAEVFSLVLQEPELLRAILFAFTQPKIMTLISDANAFERGWYDEDQRGIPDVTKDKLIITFLSEVNIDAAKLMKSPVISQLMTLLSPPQCAEKIANLVQDGKRHMFFVSPQRLENWPRYNFPLTQIKIPMKPVGFYWTIRGDDGAEGILMGSMHLTAKKLVNFPRKIMELFDSSDAMAVEIDITREDVVKRASEVSWEKAQVKELELLSCTEKEALFQSLKSLHPDIEASPTEELDPQTQFLIQALRKVALGWSKEAFSGLKDKNTHQSFFSTGIEDTLITRAKEKKIPIKDLETFDDHFINFSPKSSSFLPNVSCEQMKDMIEMSKKSEKEALDAVVDAYTRHSDIPQSLDELFEFLQKNPLQKNTDIMESGDLDALEVLYLKGRDSQDQGKLIQRNRNMAIKIDEFMKSGKKHFCIAGALHMAGPSSIVSFLKQTGYTVERLIVEEPLEPCVDEGEKTTSSEKRS